MIRNLALVSHRCAFFAYQIKVKHNLKTLRIYSQCGQVGLQVKNATPTV